MKTKNVFKGLLLALPLIAAPLHAQSLKLSANNIDAVVKAMTLDEKASLLVGGPQSRVPGAAGATRAVPRRLSSATAPPDCVSTGRATAHRPPSTPRPSPLAHVLPQRGTRQSCAVPAH